MSLEIEVDGWPLYSASRKQKARAHSSGEAEYCAVVSATSEAMLIREVLRFMGLEVRAELLLDSAAARGNCRREEVGTIRHLSTKVLWSQQLVKRGVVTVKACASAENRTDLETKAVSVNRLQQLMQLNGLALDRTENSTIFDEEDGQDENAQQRATVQTISDPGRGEGGKAGEDLLRAIRGTK